MNSFLVNLAAFAFIDFKLLAELVILEFFFFFSLSVFDVHTVNVSMVKRVCDRT